MKSQVYTLTTGKRAILRLDKLSYPREITPTNYAIQEVSPIYICTNDILQTEEVMSMNLRIHMFIHIHIFTYTKNTINEKRNHEF